MPDETGAVWRKSSRSGNGNNCVQVATNLLGREGAVLVRDSKAPQDGFFAVNPDVWTAFVGGVRDGAFHR
ncbi:DUF397 domain-containing protein [Salinispora arenicola]|uniref:DUF397 domain-containing protein n=1 Tax=Salinispora arenicola TaxID=168697 RepID=UPI00035F3069|nr:DUF397 domain-containing protein [Salinispora arenicola]